MGKQKSIRYDLMDDRSFDQALKIDREKGLNEREVQARRLEYGKNELAEGKKSQPI